MKCHQALSMLAAYRELKYPQVENTELDVHLEQCAECRHVLAQQSVVGNRVRLLSPLEPDPDAHEKLMHALAAEHSRFLQRSSHAHASSASSVPDFLKPYMKEQARVPLQTSDTLRAFSTAETGPLPILRKKRKKRLTPTSQFAALGLAASFLLVFLVGGLISLLVFANHGVTGGSNIASITRPSLIAPVSYTAETSYPHIASAVATREHIYYSAYGDGETQWMLEQVQGTPKNATSTPLLAKSNSSPLFVLGASQQWLIWLQFDAPQRGTQGLHQGHTPSITRTWSLNALSLALPHDASKPFGHSIMLQHGTFDTATLPTWIHTPIQGLWFIQQDILLVTSLDAKGNAQLVRYSLNSDQSVVTTSIATTSDGHILTSPTATTNGTRIFWSEEWFTNDVQPHSTLWIQETTTGVEHKHNVWRPTISVDKRLYSTDEGLFHPQVINDTLFLLSTSGSSATTQSTPNTTPTSVAQAKNTPVSTTPVTSRFANVYATQIDESIHGAVLAFSLSDPTAQPTTLSSDSTAAALQAGTNFLLWQSSTGYEMYDAFAKSAIEVRDSTKGAAFLAVNGDSAVWITPENSSTQQTTGVQTATFNMFNWPA
ncbi:MAG: hypothetical protein NVSMB49_04760 [Ktedonobacteraceae bacterium]